MDRLRLQWSIIPRPTKVSGHADRQSVTHLFAPLADGVFAGTAFGDHVLIASATVALAVQGLSSILSSLSVARTGGAHADVHGIRVGGLLEL